MSDITIDFEWTDPLAAKGVELRATWARLSIVVDGFPVTRVYDEPLKTMRDAVYLPLYPLAEWLAEKWWALWNEPGPSRTVDRRGYDERHCLVHAREGYALPPLRIEPAGSLVLASWSSERLPFHRLEFRGHGQVWLDTETTRDKFASLVNAVVGRLDISGITNTPLQQDWLSIQSADTEETTFCECAGALGLDPYTLEEDQEREIEEVGNLMPEEIVAEFFRAARTGNQGLRADAHEVLAAVEKAQSSTVDIERFRGLRQAVSTWDTHPGAAPWEQGYLFARRLRTHVGLDGSPLQSMESICAAMGATLSELERALSEFSGMTLPFAALVGVNRRESPSFVLRPAPHETSRRFHFCRALFEYLHSPIKRFALVTDANTDRQKRNGAFAAELLAPASVLRTLISPPMATWEQVEEVADRLGVSAYVLIHQLENHGIAAVLPL